MDRYKLNIQRDVDVDGYGDDASVVLCTPTGWRMALDDDGVHTRAFDTMRELRAYVRSGGVVRCTACANCKQVAIR